MEVDWDTVGPGTRSKLTRAGQGHRAVPAPSEQVRQPLRSLRREQHVDIGEIYRLGTCQR